MLEDVGLILVVTGLCLILLIALMWVVERLAPRIGAMNQQRRVMLAAWVRLMPS